MLNDIRKRAEECFQIAEKFYGEKIPRVQITFDLTGKTAGMACMEGKKLKMRFNRKLALANREDFLKTVVPHEISHILQFQRFDLKGVKTRPHGNEFKYIMVKVFGLPPARCHRYDVSSVQRNTRSYLYTCSNCFKEYPLGPKRHKNMNANPGRYICKCGGKLNFFKRKTKAENRAPVVNKLPEMDLTDY